jgi:exosome complex component RRP42
MSEKIYPNLEKKNMLKILDKGKRMDGRAFDEFRPVFLETGVYNRAVGSASVKIGGTFIACGVKVGEGEPYPDSPNSGVITSNADLVPVADPEYQAGPPSEESIELARVVDRGIRESHAIDLDKLCVKPGELVKMVYIDNYVLDFDGNFIDASALATCAALHTAEIKGFGKLPISKKPIANTFCKIGKHILLDANLEEERCMDARLTVTIEDKGHICAMQKAGSGNFTVDEIKYCVKTAQKRTKELRKLIK